MIVLSTGRAITNSVAAILYAIHRDDIDDRWLRIIESMLREAAEQVAYERRRRERERADSLAAVEVQV